MTNSREAAWAKAQQTTTNKVGTCQSVTRGYYGAAPAGDRDHDGDADAVDGWASEPLSARHEGDRNPPLGVPLAFSGGSHGFGHRMISGPPRMAGRSTDMHNGVYTPGVTGAASIADIEREMHLHYLGWSETIDGEPIPYDHPAANHTTVRVVPKRHDYVPRAVRNTEAAAIKAEARGQKARAKTLRAALALLRRSTRQKNPSL